MLRRNSALFCWAYGMYTVTIILQMTVLPYIIEDGYFSMAAKYIRYMAYVLVLLKIISDRYKVSQLMMFALVGMGFLLAGRLCGNNLLITSYFFVLGMKNLDIKKILKFSFVVMVICMTFTLIMTGMGIFPNWVYMQENRVRWCLGYGYPSDLSSMFFYTAIVGLAVKKKILNLTEAVALALLNILVYKMTDSRASFYLMMVVIVVFLLAGKILKSLLVRNFIRCCCIGAFPLCAIASLITSFLYGKWQIVYTINTFLSNRPQMASEALGKYGIRLWGQHIEWTGFGGLGYIYDVLPGEYNYVDNSYMKILFDYGLIVLLFVVVCFTVSVWIFARRGWDMLCLALAFIAVYSILEPRLWEFGYNPFILCVYPALVAMSSNKVQRSRQVKERLSVCQ